MLTNLVALIRTLVDTTHTPQTTSPLLTKMGHHAPKHLSSLHFFHSPVPMTHRTPTPPNSTTNATIHPPPQSPTSPTNRTTAPQPLLQSPHAHKLTIQPLLMQYDRTNSPPTSHPLTTLISIYHELNPYHITIIPHFITLPRQVSMNLLYRQWN